MKVEKKSFIVYCDIEENLDRMTDEEVGILFRSMVHYSNTGEEPELDRLMTFIFTPIRQQMDRDKEKWDGIKESRSRAGKKGGENSAKARAERNKALQEGKNDVIKDKQRLKNPSKRSKSQANQAVNVNVNVNDNVNVNVNDNVIQLADDLSRPLEWAIGTSYEREKEDTCYLVAKLLQEGHTEEEMRAVVKYQIRELESIKDINDRAYMEMYSNPTNLFGDAYESVLSNMKKYNEHQESMKRLEQIKAEEENNERHNIQTDNKPLRN